MTGQLSAERCATVAQLAASYRLALCADSSAHLCGASRHGGSLTTLVDVLGHTRPHASSTAMMTLIPGMRMSVIPLLQSTYKWYMREQASVRFGYPSMSHSTLSFNSFIGSPSTSCNTGNFSRTYLYLCQHPYQPFFTPARRQRSQPLSTLLTPTYSLHLPRISNSTVEE